MNVSSAALLINLGTCYPSMRKLDGSPLWIIRIPNKYNHPFVSVSAHDMFSHASLTCF